MKQKKDQTNNVQHFLEGRHPYWWLSLPVGLFFTGLMIGVILKMGEIGRVFNDVPALLGYTALSIFVYQISRKWLPWLHRFFTWISGFSYSLYLTHVLVLHLCLAVLGGLAFTIPLVLAYLAVALLAGRGFESVNEKVKKRSER